MPACLPRACPPSNEALGARVIFLKESFQLGLDRGHSLNMRPDGYALRSVPLGLESNCVSSALVSRVQTSRTPHNRLSLLNRSQFG